MWYIKRFMKTIYGFLERVYRLKYWDNIYLLSLFTTALFMLTYYIIAIINYVSIFWDEVTLLVFCIEYGIMHVKIVSLSILTGLIAIGIVFSFWFTRAFRNILGNFKRSSIIKFTVIVLAPAISLSLLSCVINEYAIYLLANAARAGDLNEYTRIKAQYISLNVELATLLPLITYACLFIYLVVLPTIVFGSSTQLYPGVKSERGSIIVMSFIALLVAGLAILVFSIPLDFLLNFVDFAKQPLIKPDEYLVAILYNKYRSSSTPFDICYYARDYYENLYPNIRMLTLLSLTYPHLIVYYFLIRKLIVDGYLEPYL